ncbi:MAG: redox-sensing transcriptional repressor Rex [Muribaculaceae bacterium]|nr:redox-sensing transcriptional repressor Rex [Muribaculaceae bacterium]
MTDHRIILPKDAMPEPTLRRLPWYLAYVSLLKSSGVESVSSTQIAKEINVDASMIAKDLSFLNIKGKTRIGYEVKRLERELQDFLGFKKGHNAVIVGVGSLGAALIQDSGLLRYGLSIVAGFDINPSIVGSSICNVPVYDIAELSERCSLLNAEIGIVTVPTDHAQEVSDRLVNAGIKALWNFTPFRISAKDGIVIQNTSIYAHLAVMYNRIGIQKDRTKK